MKKIAFTIAFFISAFALHAQDIKKEAENVKTKMDAFASRAGIITKSTDTKLPDLKTNFSPAETRIRKISSGASSGFFYQISKSGKYTTSTASIEYNDLLEVLKAVKALKGEVEKDMAANPDYLENKFTTTDGFQVGYYLEKGKAVWYLRLEKYGSDNTLFVDNGDTIEMAFIEAKNKIEELKKTS